MRDVNFAPIQDALRGRKASEVRAPELARLLGSLMRAHDIYGDTPGQFAFVAAMLRQCPETDEQLRVMCMRVARLICNVHDDAISKCLATDYGIGADCLTVPN